MTLNPALIARAQMAAAAADPLARFDWPGKPHRVFCEQVCDRQDSVLSAANQGAKTWTGAALAVSFSQGRAHLGDLRLPVLPVPNVGAVNVESHKVQVDSSQAAILHWLGDAPHDIGWLNRADNVIGTIFVGTKLCKHGGGQHCRTCSRIVFVSQENPDRVLGARWDWAWGDEPPAERVWDEIRKNCRYKWITETPLEFSKWEWIERQYIAALGAPKGGRFLIRASIWDNRYLSDERKRELIAGYEGSPFKRARMTGEPVDAEGATPWGDLGFARLQEMVKAAREPDVWEFPLASAHRSSERVARLEVFHEYEADEIYYANLDGSMGVEMEAGEVSAKKKGRDPSGMHIYARRRPRLVARYGGYLVPETLGHFGARAAEMYGGALVDVENQGGWGDAILIGLRNGGCRTVLGGDKRPSKIGTGLRAQGFATNAVTRGLYIGAVQDQILHGGIEMPSAAVVRAALSMRVDNNGKILARAGLHDEDVILWGRAAHWLARNPPEPYRKPVETVHDAVVQEWHRERMRLRQGGGKQRTGDDAWE